MLYSLSPSRITTYAPNGNKIRRWALQLPDAVSGFDLQWKAEADVNKGRPPNLVRQLAFRGWRQILTLKWSRGLLSSYETWTAGAWVATGGALTAMAIHDILLSSDDHDLYVEPVVGSSSWAFYARGFSNPMKVQDEKGVVHSQLDLTLEGVALASSIPAAS